MTGHGQYSGLSVTVNQTANLTNQAVSVTWTGGSPTFSDPTSETFDSTFNGNYLQIFQCWGDPQTSDPPGAGRRSPALAVRVRGREQLTRPRRTRSRTSASSTPGSSARTAGTATRSCRHTPGTYLDTTDNFVIEPFDAVDGTVVNQQADYNYHVNPVQAPAVLAQSVLQLLHHQRGRLRPHLLQRDGPAAVPGGHRAGSARAGLRSETSSRWAGGTTTPQCWLVVVPRSTPTVENPANVTNVSSVVTSPLTPEAWANRIAIPLQFNPVGSSCSINANAQEIIGGELAAPAVAAWQPALCNLPGKTPFSYIQNSDDQARQNLTNPSYGSVGMSVFSNPIPPGQTKASNPVVYAPLTLSGVVVAFNIERDPITEPDGNLQPQELGLSGDRVAAPLSHPAAGGPAADRVVPRPAPGRHRRHVAARTRGSRTTRPACSPTRPSSSTTRSSPSSAPSTRTMPAPCWSRRGAPTPPRPCGSGCCPTPRRRRGSTRSPGRGPTRA